MVVTAIQPKANSNGASSYFKEGGYNAYATFDVKYQAGASTPSGNLTFTSSRYRRKIVSIGIDSLNVSGKTAVFSGPCTMNGYAGYYFTATVVDNATLGSGADTFSITVTGPNGFTSGADRTGIGWSVDVGNIAPYFVHWMADSGSEIPPGDTLGSFWFRYSADMAGDIGSLSYTVLWGWDSVNNAPYTFDGSTIPSSPPVPEPGTLALMAVGVIGVGIAVFLNPTFQIRTGNR